MGPCSCFSSPWEPILQTGKLRCRKLSTILQKAIQYLAYSESDPWTGSVTWERIRNAGSQRPQTVLKQNLHFRRVRRRSGRSFQPESTDLAGSAGGGTAVLIFWLGWTVPLGPWLSCYLLKEAFHDLPGPLVVLAMGFQSSLPFPRHRNCHIFTAKSGRQAIKWAIIVKPVRARPRCARILVLKTRWMHQRGPCLQGYLLSKNDSTAKPPSTSL